jgi:microsomal epoxide hydrolase
MAVRQSATENEAMPTPVPFTIRAPDEVLADLRVRLDGTRWPDEHPGGGWRYGSELAYGLTDSPVGLAAWIVEEFRTWSDCGGDVERRFSKDQLLTNVMLYWVTGAFRSSFWPCRARRLEPGPIDEGHPVLVPTAYASFPKEPLHPPHSWVGSSYPNLRRWTLMPAGGHLAALEEPEALAADIRTFFRELRCKPACVPRRFV